MSVPSPALASPQLQTKAAPAPITPSQRRPTTSRSIGFTPSSATDNDWRERDMLSPPGIGNGGYSPSKVVSGGVQASPRSAGPGKTIGGFDKKDNGKEKDKEDKDKDGKSEFRRSLRLVARLGLAWWLKLIMQLISLTSRVASSSKELVPRAIAVLSPTACLSVSHCTPRSQDALNADRLAGKKEICQWFLKGNCKFGHKCKPHPRSHCND